MNDVGAGQPNLFSGSTLFILEGPGIWGSRIVGDIHVRTHCGMDVRLGAQEGAKATSRPFQTTGLFQPNDMPEIKKLRLMLQRRPMSKHFQFKLPFIVVSQVDRP
jgi:hypothetical protein